MRHPLLASRVFAAAFIVLSTSGCLATGPSKADQLEIAMNDAAMTVPGIQSTLINVNMNTSGNFITAKLVGNSMDQAELADALRRALPPMLEETSHLDGGTFSTSIFSPDDSVSVGASDFGYSGGASLERFREYFLD